MGVNSLFKNKSKIEFKIFSVEGYSLDQLVKRGRF